MTCVAKGDEILLHIATQNASRLNMMDLKIFGTSASLASPAVALEHLMTKLPVRNVVQTEPGLSQTA